MPIPDFQTLMLPLLRHVADGQQHTIAASRDSLADEFRLTEDERNQRLPSGAANTFYNRLAWAKIYLERAGLITKVKRGVFSISQRGQEVVTDPPEKITISYLQQFPEFEEFRKKGASGEDSDSKSEPAGATETPEEQIESAYDSLRKELAAELLTHVRNLHPSSFEQLVVDLMLKMGYGGPGDDAGSVTPYGSDGGIDGVINEDTLGLDVVYLQAKRWEGSVGRPEIQKFVGVLHGKRARKGVFLTTSSFSSGAYEYVKTIDPRVILIDGRKLSQLMIDFDVGVSTAHNYTIKRVDSDYFDFDVS